MTPAHLHLILNHGPVVGLPLAALLLFVAWMRDSRELRAVALAGVVLVSLAAVPAFLTGEPAEKQIEHAPGVVEKTIEAHEDMAKFALGLSLLTGLTALVVLMRSRKLGPSRGGVGVTLLVTLATAAVLALTAERGGHVRHPEVVPGALPAATGTQSGERGEKRGD